MIDDFEDERATWLSGAFTTDSSFASAPRGRRDARARDEEYRGAGDVVSWLCGSFNRFR